MAKSKHLIKYEAFLRRMKKEGVKYINVVYPNGDFKDFLPEDWYGFREGIKKIEGVKITPKKNWTDFMKDEDFT